MRKFFEPIMFVYFMWTEIRKYWWWATEANEDEALVSAFMDD